ncbi:hypothetical protein [Pedobacter nototheniae]|uniref:hypothetical protein n=1 Tax=Pedobacter nototheniae TaxID=2488994 RepID=UPI002931DE57|nr:hypothetical protein [Pedobacter nototheniae]
MKKLLLAGLAVFMLSCKTPAISPIGTTETSFKQKNRTAELVSAVADGTSIYRVSRRTFDSVSTPFYSFYYFYHGKLVRYEQAAQPDDYKFIR